MMTTIKQGNQKFYIGDHEEEPLAEITFRNTDKKTITVDHTYVSEELRGQKIAGKLVEKIVEYARENDLKIIPECSYVKAKMEKTESYHDLFA